MAKFYGQIGFVSTELNSVGVFEDAAKEKTYVGDLLKNNRQWISGEFLNDDVGINLTISIVADAYMIDNVYAIKYVVWRGKCWKVVDVDIQHPRIILSIRGLYNGARPE